MEAGAPEHLKPELRGQGKQQQQKVTDKKWFSFLSPEDLWSQSVVIRIRHSVNSQ